MALIDYDFKDALGHPLENCMYYQDAIRVLKVASGKCDEVRMLIDEGAEKYLDDNNPIAYFEEVRMLILDAIGFLEGSPDFSIGFLEGSPDA